MISAFDLIITDQNLYLEITWILITDIELMM